MRVFLCLKSRNLVDMNEETFSPPYSALNDFEQDVRLYGYAALATPDFERLAGMPTQAFESLKATWDDLPPDEWLRDGGKYRFRRHASLWVENDEIALQPHRAHFQPVDYNALHGGLHRMFAPVLEDTLSNPAWRETVLALARACNLIRGVDTKWFVEAHQFRIDTGDGLGRPTPEGAHRDGVDFVAVILVDRVNITGGETRVFDYNGPNGQRFVLRAPWSLLFMEDARVIHESTPIRRAVEDRAGHRDTLVLTYRANAFIGED